MSLFRRTVANLDSVCSELTSISNSDPSSDVKSRKERVERLQESLRDISQVVNRFVEKADAGERDVNKRLYGKTMVEKIRQLHQRVREVENTAAELREKVMKEWQLWTEELRVEEEQKVEREKKEKETEKDEEERKSREIELLKQEEEGKIKEKQEMEKKQLERERREMQERKKRKDEEERIRKEEEIRRKKEEDERKKAERIEKEKEEERRKKEKLQADSAKASARDTGFTLTVKTAASGSVMKVGGISLDTSVNDLMRKIGNDHDIPVDAQRLIFAGRILEPSKKLSDYGVKRDSTVHLVLKGHSQSTRSTLERMSTPEVTSMVAPGTVFTLTNGSAELESILKACRTRRLAVVNWSSSRSAPCRTIAPTFERFARRFRDVTFVSIDTRATPANVTLAGQAQIGTFPTFHFYVNQQRACEVLGAKATEIERRINQYREAEAASGASSSDSYAPLPVRSGRSGQSGQSLQQRILNALQHLKNHCSRSEFVVAVRTLLTFVQNVTNHPNEEKYRKVRTANPVFQSRLGSKRGGLECMRAFGFEPVTTNGEDFLVLSPAAAQHPELRIVKRQLEQALEGAGGGSGSRSNTTLRGATQGTAGNATFGLGPGGIPGQPDFDNEVWEQPAFAALVQQMMQDPEMIVALTRARRLFQDRDPNALRYIQNEPAMRRLQEAIMADPQLLAQLMQHGMPGMGGPNAGMPGLETRTENPNAEGAGTEQQHPTIPGAPATVAEEERMLQEAIQLSMQESENAEDADNPSNGTDNKMDIDDKNGASGDGSGQT